MGILIQNISLLRSCPMGGQEFGDGVPVSRQQHPCACKRPSLCGPKNLNSGVVAMESAKDGA